MLKLAIDHPELGPRIKEVRVLTPKEVKAEDLIKDIRKKLIQLEALDKDMKARLEKALDDGGELKELASLYVSEEDRLRRGMWPDDKTYRVLEEANLITQFVVEAYRPNLVGFRIAVLFQETVPPVAKRGRLGTMTKLPGKMKYLAERDAFITLGYHNWHLLTDTDRQRLVHHELEHLVLEDGSLSLRGHDFEDFVSIWGLYGPGSQLGIFSSDSVAGRIEVVGSQLDMMEATG